jgi:hypothetical protein
MSEPRAREPKGAAVPGLRSRFVATREGAALKRPEASGKAERAGDSA